MLSHHGDTCCSVILVPLSIVILIGNFQLYNTARKPLESRARVIAPRGLKNLGTTILRSKKDVFAWFLETPVAARSILHANYP